MKNILVTTDFSPESQVAFAIAKEHAELCGRENCRLLLLSVLEDLAPTSVQFEFALTLIDTKEILDESFKQATSRIQEIREEFFADYQVETEVVRATKPVHLEILDYAQENDAQLIVMATHGRTGVKRFVIGSVSEKVVREARCPVLVVPAGKAKED